MSIEKTFAAVDRKVDKYTFTLKKIVGDSTKTEYHIVDVEAPMNGDLFEKHSITLACPADAIKSAATDLLQATNLARREGGNMVLRQVSNVPEDNQDAILTSTFIRRILSELKAEASASAGVVLNPVKEKIVLTQVPEKVTLTRIDDDDDDNWTGARYCYECDTYLENEFNFCPICGTEL